MDDIKYDIVIVADTNIVMAGCRSRNGASFLVLKGMVAGPIRFAASPALVLEYEDVLKRPGLLGTPPVLSERQVDLILDALCEQAVQALPWYRFRPFLDDPKDDLVIECALAAGAEMIVTNDRHYDHPAVRAFGFRRMTAGDLVAEMQTGRRPT